MPKLKKNSHIAVCLKRGCEGKEVDSLQHFVHYLRLPQLISMVFLIYKGIAMTSSKLFYRSCVIVCDKLSAVKDIMSLGMHQKQFAYGLRAHPCEESKRTIKFGKIIQI